jgi:hypothetical protein
MLGPGEINLLGGYTMKKKIIVGIFLFSLVFALATAGKSDVELGIVEDMNMIDAWGNGYPTNARGETYGVDVKENSKSPDLILVENSEGILGYVKSEDLDGSNYLTPEEAILNQSQGYSVDMYLSDGETKVGEFHIGR